jgi:WD40 repeat protein
MPCDCIYTVSPNLSLLATSERAQAETSPITIWDTSTGVQLQSLQPDKGITTFLAFTPDGQMLWRASDRGNLTAWDTSEWNFLGENIGGVTPIFNLRSFQFVGDGRHYLISSDLLLALYGLP